MSTSVIVTKNTQSESHIFAVNLSLKLFRVTVTNADTKLLALHTLFETYLGQLAKFEPNRTVRNVQNFELLTKIEFLKAIFDKALTPFCKTFL